MTALDDQLRRVIAETLAVPEDVIGESASTETLPAWDSVAHLSLVVAIESAFAIKLSMREIEVMTSFKRARDVLQQRLGA